MYKIVAKPLTQMSFAHYGDVIEVPSEIGRAYFNDALKTERPAASPVLWISRAEAAIDKALQAKVMERHSYSSQSFVPLQDARWLIVVAPEHPNGGRPDMMRAEAFLPSPGQGITYRAGTWHHPMTVLEGQAVFAVFMWKDGTETDEEFVDIDPVIVEWQQDERI